MSVIDWYARKSPSVDGQSIAHAQRKRSSESQADSLKNSWLKIGNLSKNSGIACLAFLLFLSSRQRINLQKRIQETIVFILRWRPSGPWTIICLLNPRFLELISWVVKVRARQVWPQGLKARSNDRCGQPFQSLALTNPPVQLFFHELVKREKKRKRAH